MFKARPVHNGALMIECPEDMDAISAREFKIQMNEWLKENFKVIVLDMKNVMQIDRAMYRPLAELKHALGEQKKQLFSLNLKKNLFFQLDRDGMRDVLPPLEGPVIYKH